MDADDFEGTLVLEKLAEINKIDEFYEAIDSDDFGRAAKLLRAAGLDSETIQFVLDKMRDPDGRH